MSSNPDITTARDVLDHAPLGAIIRFADGQPRPPERFKRKLRDWETRNGTGRLVERNAGQAGRSGTFSLRIGDYGDRGVIIIKFNRVYSADSQGTFTVDSLPGAGEALIITERPGRTELQHLAPDEASARRWLAEHHYPGARIEIASGTEPDRAAA